MKNPKKTVKIIVIFALIAVLAFGAVAIVNQNSQLTSETSKLPSSASPQIQKEPTKAKVESMIDSVQTEPLQSEPIKTEPAHPEPIKIEPSQPELTQPESVPPESNFVCLGTKECITGTVEKIVDGDTLYINGIKIRISLTNTPELNQKGFSEATEFTKNLCPVGSLANVDQDDLQPIDDYGRMLGKVTCSGKVLNSELLYHNLATISPRYCSTSEFSSESWAQEYGCSAESKVVSQQMQKEIPAPTSTQGNCDPSYPDVCIAPYPPDLDCKNVPYKKFKVLPPDPHHFDGDKDGIGCE